MADLFLARLASHGLLEKEKGASGDEVGEGLLHGDDGSNIAEVLIETTKCSQDEGFVKDDITNIDEGVGENFQLVASGSPKLG